MTTAVVFDYGFGNVRSMVRAMARLGVDTTLTSDYRQAMEADGLVVVYYMDQKTVYEYTDIPVVSLPERMKRSIRDGNCLLDVHELYDFLENYSS